MIDAFCFSDLQLISFSSQPHESPVHFQITPNESYGICCIQGLKISMGMHEFGEKSRANSLLKDFRSTNKTKTRMTGDSGLTIRQTLIAEQMLKAVKTNTWQQHFKNLLNEFNIPSLDELDPLVCSLKKAVMEHALSSKSFKLQNLRMQLSATRDNMYIGMEITREYEKWKNDISDDLIGQFITKKMSKVEMKHVGELRTALMHHIDRLWFESCLEIMRESDIYGLRAGHLVPKFFTIDDTKGTSLNNILIGESFRLMDSPEAIYEVLVKMKNQIVVRNAVGFIVRMEPKTMVYRGGNLTRELDRNKESKFSLATFSVGHHVNHRTVRLSNKSEGYVFASIFDEQSTRHLMPYSGLSGACTNVMLFNDFVKEAIHGVSFVDRLARFSSGRDWSSSEVVTSGVGSLFGRDSFLRPGFSYVDAIEYIYCKVIERMETGQYLDDLLSGEYLDDILSRDWKAKFAASLIPRGMELNKDFISAMYERIQDLVFEKFVSEVKKDKFLAGRALVENLLAHRVQMKRFQNDLNRQSYWTYFVDTLEGVNDSTRGRLRGYHVEIAFRTDQSVVHIIEYATKGYLYNERIVAEICSEPRSVDTVFENFAMDAQHMANSLVLSAAFSSGALAFVLFDFSDQRWGLGKNFGSILAGLNIIISFGTMIRVSRYKKRNEEARVSFFDDKLLGLLQASFASMSIEDQNVVSQKENPFVLDLDNHVQKFREHASYYGVDNFEASGFSEAYNRLRQKVNDPAAVRGFQYKLATVFIAVVYHENSHVQECLVDIYKICANMLRLLEQENDIPSHRRATQHLFRRLSNFTPRLGKSVLSGNITHWHIFTVLRYFWSVLCCTTMCGANPLAPIQTEILGILREVRNVSAGYKNTILLREIRDLETLYRATCESDTASIIFVAAFLVHVVSWIFSSYRIISLVDGPSIVRDIAAWASLASSLSAIIGAFHFQRKFLILFRLWCILGGKVRAAPTSDDKAEIMKIKAVTFGRMVLSSLRLLAAYGAGVALGGSIAIFQFSDQVGMVEEIPFWIAMGAVSSAILAMIMERIIQSRLYYRLSPRLGEYVCEAFRTEIELMHMSATMSMPFNDIDTKQEQEREAWEYTAREFLHKYRWDAVFEADRFGSILQYLQSGMDPRA